MPHILFYLFANQSTIEIIYILADVCHFAQLPRIRLIAHFRVSH